jgi:CheY-like chemotaxis protein
MERFLQREVLEPAGFDIVEAKTGTAALQLFIECKPDLVVLDVMMPEMNGFELVARLRGQDAMRRVPIIVLSAHDLDPAEVETLRGNVERFISKAQAQPADICATLRQTINWSHEPELSHAS